HGSIDMLYNGKDAYVLEVNSSANISMHMFRTKGHPRNVPGYIVDHYFPESISNKEKHQNMYFNYLDMLECLKKNYTNYIEIKSIDLESVFTKKFVVHGYSLNKRFQSFISNQAFDKGLNGFIKILS